MLQVLLRVMSYKVESFKGRDGNQVNWTVAMVRIGDTVLKLSSDVDLSSFVDKDVNVNIRVSADRNLNPKLRVVGVSQSGK